MRATVMVIEDDRDLCTLLEYNLTNNGYCVITRGCLGGAHEAIRESQPDLILLDVMLPDGSGFDFCRQLRANDSTVAIPVVFLTARSEEMDRVLGLELGGDDYITKPFSPRELLARIKARLRRRAADRPRQHLAASGLEIDASSRQARLNGKLLQLTATEFAILDAMAATPGRAFTRQQLIARVWKGRTLVTPRNIDVHIRRLREQIEAEPKRPRWIQTVRGYGYRLEIPS